MDGLLTSTGESLYRETALGRRNPEVGATGVENNGEFLRGSAYTDLTIVLGIEIVLQMDTFGNRSRRRRRGEAIGIEMRCILQTKLGGLQGVVVDGFLLEIDAMEGGGGGEEGREEKEGNEEEERSRSHSHFGAETGEAKMACVVKKEEAETLFSVCVCVLGGLLSLCNRIERVASRPLFSSSFPFLSFLFLLLAR